MLWIAEDLLAHRIIRIRVTEEGTWEFLQIIVIMEVQETMMETDLTDGDGGSTWSLSVPTSTSNLNFHLTFDRDLAVFMPGQTVSGVIYFQLLVPESFKGLFFF